MTTEKKQLVPGALVALMVFVTPVSAAGTLEIVRGKTLVEKNCSRCHAIGRTGESQHPAAPSFRTLTQRYPLANLEESLAEGISTGHPDMPEFQIQPGEISDIISYLTTIQKSGSSTP